MNDLSWIIYLADVADNLDWLLFWMGLIGLLGLIISALIWMNDGDNWPTANRQRTMYYFFTPMFFFGAIVGAIIPAKETLYAIAASELGEEIVRSPTAGKAVAALNSWLDRQIAGEPVPTEEENKN
jgi:hypothetical protein